MTGINNGVHKGLKEEYGLKDLVLISCECHSLQLAVSHASNDAIPVVSSTWYERIINGFQCLQSAGRPIRPFVRPSTVGKNPYR